MAKHQVLLDTDIGSDIDDAVCLAYLLVQPDCELLGITTVTGESPRRAEMASALCRAAGVNVPVIAGAERPLIAPQRQLLAPQARALSSWAHQAFEKAEPFLAVDFLRKTIRANPGKVTLLAIGPLTNIGLLFAIDPEIPTLLKNLTLMCGHFAPQAGGEWNAGGDPHATRIVYQAEVNEHCSVGLDVTQKVVMGAGEVRKRFRNGLLRLVLDFAEVWFEERNLITFHDPLAAVTLFDEGVCTFELGTVNVDISAELAGTTRWKPDPDGGHAIAMQVEPQRFFEHFHAAFR